MGKDISEAVLELNVNVTNYHSGNSVLLAFCAPSLAVPRPTFRYHFVATLQGKMNHFVATFSKHMNLAHLCSIYGIYIITVFSCILLARHAHALPSQNILYATS